MNVTLYMFSGSHSVRMAELMLEHKGITDYKRVNMLPAGDGRRPQLTPDPQPQLSPFPSNRLLPNLLLSCD